MKTFLCLAALLCSALVVTPQDAPKKKVVYLSFMDGFKDARKAGLQSMMVARDLSEEDLAKEYENAKKNKMGFAVVRPGDEAYDEFTPGVTKITVTPKLKAGVKEDPSLSFYVDYDQAAGECIKQDKNLALWVGITPKEAPSFRRAMDGALHCYLESMEGCPDRSVVVKGNDDYSYIISQESSQWQQQTRSRRGCGVSQHRLPPPRPSLLNIRPFNRVAIIVVMMVGAIVVSLPPLPCQYERRRGSRCCGLCWWWVWWLIIVCVSSRRAVGLHGRWRGPDRT
jgi:hypothetical protein